jgi:hypothetical protein
MHAHQSLTATGDEAKNGTSEAKWQREPGFGFGIAVKVA